MIAIKTPNATDQMISSVKWPTILSSLEADREKKIREMNLEEFSEFLNHF
jgi:hypothetical protein